MRSVSLGVALNRLPNCQRRRRERRLSHDVRLGDLIRPASVEQVYAKPVGAFARFGERYVRIRSNREPAFFAAELDLQTPCARALSGNAETKPRDLGVTELESPGDRRLQAFHLKRSPFVRQLAILRLRGALGGSPQLQIHLTFAGL